MNGASYIKFKKFNLQVIATLQKNAIPVTTFCNWLEDLLNSTSLDIILRKINENTKLALALSSY